MNKQLVFSLAAGLAAAMAAPSVFAKDYPDDQDEAGASRWGIGLAVVATDSPYAGEGTRTTPFPLVSFAGEKFFFQGITAGWRFIETDSFTVAAVAQARLDGFDIDDLGRKELAANGLDYRLLEDRDDSVDVGMTAGWKSTAGELELELLADATDTSGGYQAALSYGYPVQFGKTRVTFNVGVRWLSDALADYYYGTLDEEVARGLVDYKPGAVVVPHIGIDVSRPIGRKWAAFASLEYQTLPSEVEDSPFIEAGRDDETSVLIGISRGF